MQVRFLPGSLLSFRQFAHWAGVKWRDIERTVGPDIAIPMPVRADEVLARALGTALQQ